MSEKTPTLADVLDMLQDAHELVQLIVLAAGEEDQKPIATGGIIVCRKIEDAMAAAYTIKGAAA